MPECDLSISLAVSTLISASVYALHLLLLLVISIVITNY